MSTSTPTPRVPQARLALCIGQADTYRLERLEADPSVALAAWSLTKGGDPLTVKNVGATFHVRQDPEGCSECVCPDATYRQRPCKHQLALHRVGLLPLPPQVNTVEQLAYLKAALRWAADQRLIPAVPKFVMPKVPKKSIIRKIEAEEFERLLTVAPDDGWRAFQATAWYTGMRRNEMLDLT